MGKLAASQRQAIWEQAQRKLQQLDDVFRFYWDVVITTAMDAADAHAPMH